MPQPRQSIGRVEFYCRRNAVPLTLTYCLFSKDWVLTTINGEPLRLPLKCNSHTGQDTKNQSNRFTKTNAINEHPRPRRVMPFQTKQISVYFFSNIATARPSLASWNQKTRLIFIKPEKLVSIANLQSRSRKPK